MTVLVMVAIPITRIQAKQVSENAKIPLLVTGFYRIASLEQPELVFDVAYSSRENGAIIHLWKYSRGAHQQVKAIYLGDNTYIFEFQHAEQVITAMCAEQPIVTYPRGSGNYQWTLLYAGNGAFYIRNIATGLYLTIEGDVATQSARIVQYSNLDSDSQRWLFLER